MQSSERPLTRRLVCLFPLMIFAMILEVFQPNTAIQIMLAYVLGRVDESGRFETFVFGERGGPNP